MLGGGTKGGDKFKKRTKASGAKISQQEERALAFYSGDAGQKGVSFILASAILKVGVWGDGR